ncbi:MAG: hypothetical protein HN521_12985 [Candidatus Latescibacteria bacterium]|nr:hypothetical protein [Candidatus Latescibacterota bacterium]MBT5832118.1 hypothetical protein [Candidatus Latescibacterota bacterium]
MERAYPSFRINSFQEAHAFYIDFLGFEVYFEWREAPDAPVYMGISKGSLAIHLFEHKIGLYGASAVLDVKDAFEVYEELVKKKPDMIEKLIDQPWGKSELHLRDPFGNKLNFTSGTTPTDTIVRAIPVLRIGNYEEAVSYYVDYLGFRINFEWRHHANFPIYMGISKGDLALHLTEHEGDVHFGTGTLMDVDNISLLYKDLLNRKPKMTEELINQPWKKTELHLRDPFENLLIFTS